jgi:hypothetical protein
MALMTLELEGEPMNTDLMRAIAEKRLIEFVYKTGRSRIVEPHDYGVRNGVETLLAWPISGESRSGTPHGWKWFEVENMRQLLVLDRQFPGSRADSSQHHARGDTLFARVM